MIRKYRKLIHWDLWATVEVWLMHDGRAVEKYEEEWR
jgi:hypothetical protein